MTGVDGTDVALEQMRAMLAAMSHRGPDGEGTLLGPGFAGGMVRLALVDLSENGQQPLWSPDHRVAILFNGEIYNFREERRRLANPIRLAPHDRLGSGPCPLSRVRSFVRRETARDVRPRDPRLAAWRRSGVARLAAGSGSIRHQAALCRRCRRRRDRLRLGNQGRPPRAWCLPRWTPRALRPSCIVDSFRSQAFPSFAECEC